MRRHFERERERNHIHVAFVTVCRYNRSICLVLAVSLFLCLIYKLVSITGTYV